MCNKAGCSNYVEYMSPTHLPAVRVDRPCFLTDNDAAVVEAFGDLEIQRWHVRRADSVDEARQWIEPIRQNLFRLPSAAVQLQSGGVA